MPTYRFEARYPRAGMSREAGNAVREWLRSYPGGDVTRVTKCGQFGTEMIVSFELFSGSLIAVNAIVRGLSIAGMVIEALWKQGLLELPPGVTGPDLVQPVCVRCEVRP